MNFQISNELKEKIEKNFKAYSDLKNKLLSGDADAIRQVGFKSQRGIEPEDVIEAYESNNIDYLYKQAKKMVELQKIYKELCDAYASNILKKNDNSLDVR